LHALVCSGLLPLKTAQKAIATNWYSAYQRYVLRQSPAQEPRPVASSTSASLTPQQVPEKTTSAAAPTGATGKCKDGTYSYAATHRGMCSRHGGVEVFFS